MEVRLAGSLTGDRRHCKDHCKDQKALKRQRQSNWNPCYIHCFKFCLELPNLLISDQGCRHRAPQTSVRLMSVLNRSVHARARKYRHSHTHTDAALMQRLFNSLQRLPLFAHVAIALAGSRPSWVFHLSQTLYFSARPCCPPKEVIGIPDCPTLSLSGWSFGVRLRHRWSIVGVLTKITPSHSWLTTPLPTPPLLLPRLSHGKVDLILQNPPSRSWDA